MKNVERLDNEELVTLPIGFEVSFPGLLEEAKTLGVDLPYDAPFFQVMEETRQEKLRRYWTSFDWIIVSGFRALSLDSDLGRIYICQKYLGP